MANRKKEEAEEVKKQVAARNLYWRTFPQEKEVEEELLKDMMAIPNIIDPSVPIGKDDSENVEIEKFGEPVVPIFEVPYSRQKLWKILMNWSWQCKTCCGEMVSTYLMGDIARLHSAEFPMHVTSW